MQIRIFGVRAAAALALLFVSFAAANAQWISPTGRLHLGSGMPGRYRAAVEYLWWESLYRRQLEYVQALQLQQIAAAQSYSPTLAYYQTAARPSGYQGYRRPLEEQVPPPRRVKPEAPPDDAQTARAILALARQFVDEQQFEYAEEYCRKIIDTYPQTPAAGEARHILDRLRGAAAAPR